MNRAYLVKKFEQRNSRWVWTGEYGILCAPCIHEEKVKGAKRATRSQLQAQFVPAHVVSKSNPAYCDQCCEAVYAG